MQKSVAPDHFIHLKDQIFCFDISRSDWSQNLICLGTSTTVVIGTIKFPEETESEIFEWSQLKEIHHGTRCQAIAIAPDTSLVSVPKMVMFCTSGTDFILRIFRTDLKSSDTVQTLKGHTNYVNDVAWDPEKEYLASASDDNSCIIWAAHGDFEVVKTIRLKSAGMSVCWHPDDVGRVLVAEKRGIIHLYNVKLNAIVISLETKSILLMSADWALKNRYVVFGLAAGELYSWDLRGISRPTNVTSLYEEVGRVVKICPNYDQITASFGLPNNVLKVVGAKTKVPLVETHLKLFGGICWHSKFPYVAAASDRKIYFWKVQVN